MVENSEIMPGRFIRVRNMKAQESHGDHAAFAAAMQIMGTSYVGQLDTCGSDGLNIHLGGAAGNGTIGLEILEDLPDVDTILVPYGGCNLSCGIAAPMAVSVPDVRVEAVEAATGRLYGDRLPPGDRSRSRTSPVSLAAWARDWSFRRYSRWHANSCAARAWLNFSRLPKPSVCSPGAITLSLREPGQRRWQFRKTKSSLCGMGRQQQRRATEIFFQGEMH